MGKKYLVDTNILIYYLDQSIEYSISNKIEGIFSEKINIFVITSIELLSSSKISHDQIVAYKRFLSTTNLVNISESIAFKVAEIRRNFKLKLPDAVIAATALIHDFELVTRNAKDFESIPSLSIFNPFISV